MTPDGVLPASDYPAAYTSILAMDAETAISTTTTSPSVSGLVSTPLQSSAASPTPSDAIIIYRRDVCDQEKGGAICSSFAMEYNITPGQSVNTCTQEADYTQNLHKYLASDTSDYSISVGPFNSHGLTDCEYTGTKDNIGALTCTGFVQSCHLPTSMKAVKCGVAEDTPVAYAEW